VDEFRNRHKDRGFVLVSSAISQEGVSVIAAVSSSLTSSIKAPELMKRLGLRGGGRADFAQGGGVEAADLDALRTRARELLRSLAESSGRA
jgi:alanyl-tRNA synthetase